MNPKEVRAHLERILKVQFISGRQEKLIYADKKNRDRDFDNIKAVLKSGSPVAELQGTLLLLPNVEFIKKGEIQ